jgi:hypothetical protein
MKIRFLFYLLCIVPAASFLAQAQYRQFAPEPPPPDVLSPAPRLWWIGPEAGVNINALTGSYTTEFCDCTFENGNGVGLSVGAEGGYFLFPALAIAVKVVYNDLQADSKHNATELTTVWDEQAQIYSEEMIDYQRSLHIKLSYLTINPMIEVYPFGGVYLMAGPAFGIPMNSTVEYTKQLLSNDYFFYWNQQGQTVIQVGGDIVNLRKSRIDFRVGAGINIRIGRNTFLSPEALYNLPLTKILNSGDWSAQPIHLMLALKFFL